MLNFLLFFFMIGLFPFVFAMLAVIGTRKSNEFISKRVSESKDYQKNDCDTL